MRPREARAALGVSDPTLHRWVREGVLPKPEYVGGTRWWDDKVILDLRARRLAMAKREIPPALTQGQRVRDEARELRAAAAEALVHAGVITVRDALAPWTRLREVPLRERRRLTHTFQRLTAIARERTEVEAQEPAEKAAP